MLVEREVGRTVRKRHFMAGRKASSSRDSCGQMYACMAMCFRACACAYLCASLYNCERLQGGQLARVSAKHSACLLSLLFRLLGPRPAMISEGNARRTSKATLPSGSTERGVPT